MIQTEEQSNTSLAVTNTSTCDTKTVHAFTSVDFEVSRDICNLWVVTDKMAGTSMPLVTPTATLACLCPRFSLRMLCCFLALLFRGSAFREGLTRKSTGNEYALLHLCITRFVSFGILGSA